MYFINFSGFIVNRVRFSGSVLRLFLGVIVFVFVNRVVIVLWGIGLV